MIDTFNREYFEWLCKIVGGFDTHYFLLKRLFSREFYYINEKDSNRAYDGVQLRNVYSDQLGYWDYCMQIVNGVRVDADVGEMCTVLEMLVALAIRCEHDIMNNPDKGDRTKLWFWKMLENLDIAKYDNDNWDQQAYDEVNHKIDILLDRTYKRNGQGGLFPINAKYHKDQRKVEIWYQMNTWLNENYFSEMNFQRYSNNRKEINDGTCMTF